MIDKKMRDIMPRFKITKVEGGTITEYCNIVNIVNPAEKTISNADCETVKIHVSGGLTGEQLDELRSL